jgi:hypothetical protein
MQHSRTNIVLASALVAIFMVFNVGLPIALYVCPMMASQQCKCTCSETSGTGPSYTYVHTPCCTSSLIAERNTVPFLGSQKYDPPHTELALLVSSGDLVASQQLLQSAIALNTDSGPPHSAVPLYILSSSLLI